MSHPVLQHHNRPFFLALHRYLCTSALPCSRPLREPIRHHAHRLISHPPLRYATTASSPFLSHNDSDSSRPRTHYDLFPTTLPSGPPPSGPFHIDLGALKREFLQLQARAHPDRHSGRDKARAEGTSALINEAYKTLQDPLRRAQYLLQLRGIDVAEDETLKTEDVDLLMQVLNAREAIESAEDEADLKEMKVTNQAMIKDSVDVLKKAFAKTDTETAKSEAVRLRYWTNIKQSLDAWEKGKPVVLVH
ncbi:MAG: hypothetical protein Q9195_008541 [Heterodermia aff. obscurata]